MFVCCSPGKVSTPITEVPLGQLEISDNFNVEYLLGKACRDVFQHSQVRGGVSYGRERQGGGGRGGRRGWGHKEEGGAIKRREGPEGGGRGQKERGMGREGGAHFTAQSSCAVHVQLTSSTSLL